MQISSKSNKKIPQTLEDHLFNFHLAMVLLVVLAHKGFLFMTRQEELLLVSSTRRAFIGDGSTIGMDNGKENVVTKAKWRIGIETVSFGLLVDHNTPYQCGYNG